MKDKECVYSQSWKKWLKISSSKGIYSPNTHWNIQSTLNRANARFYKQPLSTRWIQIHIKFLSSQRPHAILLCLGSDESCTDWETKLWEGQQNRRLIEWNYQIFTQKLITVLPLSRNLCLEYIVIERKDKRCVKKERLTYQGHIRLRCSWMSSWDDNRLQRNWDSLFLIFIIPEFCSFRIVFPFQWDSTR